MAVSLLPLKPESGSRNENISKKYKKIVAHRKRVGLYCLLVSLGFLILFNLGVTLWLITALRLNINGAGPIRFLENGVQIHGSTYTLGSIFTKEVRGGRDEGMNLISDRNLILRSNNSSLNLKHNTEVRTTEFRILNSEGEEVLSISSDGIRAKNRRMIALGASLQSSLQTPLVKGSAKEELVLESLTNSLRLTGAEGVQVGSTAGGISLVSFQDIKIRSKLGKVDIRGSDIWLKDIPVINASSRQSSYNNNIDIFQVCVCESGKLFLSPARSLCDVDISMCS